MNRTCLGAVLVTLLAFASSAADEGTAEAKRLAGKWQGTAGVWKGKALTAEQARQCVLLLHPPRATTDLSGGARGMDLRVPDKLVGYEIRTTTDKKETRYVTQWNNYAYALDPSATPPVLQAFKISGFKGVGFGGIYRIKGDVLTICINFNRLEKPLKEFKSPRGSEVLLLTFKRSK